MAAKPVVSFAIIAFLWGFIFLSTRAWADHSSSLVENVNGIAVVLHVSAEGVFAGEETPLRLQLYKMPPLPIASRDKEVATGETTVTTPTVSEPTLIVPIKIACGVTMPSMAGMPSINPTLATEKTAGTYSMRVDFPHGGLYAVAVQFTLPGQIKPLRVRYFLNVLDQAGNIPAKPQPYTLSVRALPVQDSPIPEAYRRRLLLKVIAREGKTVNNFETVHEKKMHLIIVSPDFQYFFHVHPQLQPDGNFILPFTFPNAGKWMVFAEVAPRNVGMQPLSSSLNIEQENLPSPASASKVTVESTNLESARCIRSPFSTGKATAAGLTLTLQSALPTAHQTSALDFLLTDIPGKPVRTIPLWLGAPAHLVAIHEDVKTFVHSHPIERTPDDIAAGKLTFLARFPKAGIYYCWLQVRNSGHILTYPMTLVVSDADKSK